MYPLSAIVLAGGASRRMGEPKAWLSFEGEPLFLRVIRSVRAACDGEIVAVAQEEQLLPTCADVRIVRDVIPNAGPLVGLLAGLRALRARHSHDAWTFVATTDAPSIAPVVVRHLTFFCNAEVDAVVP